MSFNVHPSAVEFGELECCALRKVMHSQDNAEYIRTFLALVQPAAPRYRVSILEETFESTTRFVFIPESVHQSFYTELALRERRMLVRVGGASLDCGHSVSEHIRALTGIAVKMINPQGNN